MQLLGSVGRSLTRVTEIGQGDKGEAKSGDMPDGKLATLDYPSASQSEAWTNLAKTTAKPISFFRLFRQVPQHLHAIFRVLEFRRYSTKFEFFLNSLGILAAGAAGIGQVAVL